MEEQATYRTSNDEGGEAVSKSFSFKPRHLQLVTEMAVNARHLNRSRIVQEAIEEKAQRELLTVNAEKVPA